MFPNKVSQKVSTAEILQNARVGTAVHCLSEWQAPVWVLTGFACYSPFPMLVSAISRMEIGGNRRLACPKAKRMDAVNGGAAVHLDH